METKTGNFEVGDLVRHQLEKEWGVGTVLSDCSIETARTDGLYEVCWPILNCIGHIESSEVYGNDLVKVEVKKSKSLSELEQIKKRLKKLESKVETIYLILKRIENKNES